VLGVARGDEVRVGRQLVAACAGFGERRVLLGCWGSFNDPYICDYTYRNIYYRSIAEKRESDDHVRCPVPAGQPHLHRIAHQIRNEFVLRAEGTLVARSDETVNPAMPTGEVELEIVRLKAPGISEALSEELVRTIQDLRTLDLRKAPSIGETLDWAQSLVVLGAPNLSKDLVESTISVIAKYDRDAQKMLDHLGVSAKERRDLGQKEPTGENPSEGMYEMHRSVHKHAH
jgi:hypothetical protein